MLKPKLNFKRKVVIDVTASTLSLKQKEAIRQHRSSRLITSEDDTSFVIDAICYYCDYLLDDASHL